MLLPVEVVDRSNCDAWDKPYEQRPLPEWDACVPPLPASVRRGSG
jgi:hypothetical protein